MSLLTAGGLGFPVLASLLDVRLWWRRGLRGGLRFLPVHSRLVLVTSAALVASGMLAFLFLESDGALRELSFVGKLWASFFQSATLRTAGFSTIDFGSLGTPMLLLCLVMMFVGGSPGGTAGGVKTTTFAVLFLTFRALLRGRAEVEVMGRSLPPPVVYRAAAVTFISMALLFVLSLLLLAAEPGLPFREVLFEAVSAFGTVGLTTGITVKLSSLGQLIVCLLMFVGRIGPFTLALAIGGAGEGRAEYNLPTAKVAVG